MTAPVTVTQADRDAHLRFFGGDPEYILSGQGDNLTTIGLIAAFRQQADAASKAREADLVEALEAIARNNWRDQSRAKQVAREAIMKVYAARAKASSDGGEG